MVSGSRRAKKLHFGSCDFAVTSLRELKSTVQDFADSLDAEDVKRTVRHLRRRAEMCITRNGGLVDYA